jgi:hypothetical protein
MSGGIPLFPVCLKDVDRKTLAFRRQPSVNRSWVDRPWWFGRKIRKRRERRRKGRTCISYITRYKHGKTKENHVTMSVWGRLLKVIVHPITGHKVPEGEKRYSSTLSSISALDVGWWSTPRPGRFTPGKDIRYPLYRRLDGPQSRSGRVWKISPPPGFDPRTVVSRYTDWATPAHGLRNAVFHVPPMCLSSVTSSIEILPSWLLQASLGRSVCSYKDGVQLLHTPQNSEQIPFTYKTRCVFVEFTHIQISRHVSLECLYIYALLSLESNCLVMSLIDVCYLTTPSITEIIQRQWQMDKRVCSTGAMTLKGKNDSAQRITCTQCQFSSWPGI